MAGAVRLGNCEAACETLDAMPAVPAGKRLTQSGTGGVPAAGAGGFGGEVPGVCPDRDAQGPDAAGTSHGSGLAALGNSAMEKLRQCPAQPAAPPAGGRPAGPDGRTGQGSRGLCVADADLGSGARLALCDWGCERLFEARDALADLYTRTHQPTVARCLTDICRQIGDYRTIEKIHAAADAGAKPIKSN